MRHLKYILIFLCIIIASPVHSKRQYRNAYDGTDNTTYDIIDTTDLVNCNDTTEKIDWNGTIFQCIADQTGAGGGDNVSVDSVATTDPDFQDGGDINFTNTSDVVTATVKTGVISADELDESGVASGLEAVMSHDNLVGFVANEHLDWTLASQGTIHATNYVDNDTQLSQEQIDDFVDALVNDVDSVHTRITITYDDINDALDFVVDDMNDDVPDAGDFGNATDLDGNGAISCTDCIDLAKLDDDAGTPTAGDVLSVRTGATDVTYITPNAGTDITADLEEDTHCSEHDGRSTTCSTEALNADAELYTDVKCANIDPNSSITDWLIFKAPLAMTVVGVDCIVDAATSVVLTPNECDGNGGTCTAIEAAITCGTTNTTESAGIDNSSIDAGDWVRVTRGTVSGTPNQAVICLQLEYDD